jgi:putative transposase
MFMGIRCKSYPTSVQKRVLSQWMGCGRFVWNAKCEEDTYLSTYARKYLPVGTYAPCDQTYSQYKDPELSPWLADCPSQILRNSVSNWKATYTKFLKGECGKPKRKKKRDQGSIHLTRELFKFERDACGNIQLFIGTKTNNIGILNFKLHRDVPEPSSIHLRKKNGTYWVSFCYDDRVDEASLSTDRENLEFLRECTPEYLDHHTVGIDRGVKIPVQCGDIAYDFTKEQTRKKARRERHLKRYQRRLARQSKVSNRRRKTKYQRARYHTKIANIREDFCHQTSYKIVAQSMTKVIIFEDLGTKRMTKRPKAKKDANGKWMRNRKSSNFCVLWVSFHTLYTEFITI